LAHRLTVTAQPATQAKRRRVRPGFLEKTLAGITANIEQAVFSEENARKPGFLQHRDPRAKLLAFVALIVAVGLSRDWPVLLALYALTLLAAAASEIEMGPFVRRVWLGMGLFSGIVILPSIFFVGHTALFTIPLGLFDLTVRREGLMAAGVFVLRVCASISLAILLILTTKWADILKSLRVLRVPNVFVLVLAMTYRYIFLVLHTANGMFLARKSRTIARTSGKEQRWWIVATIGVLMSRSFRMSEDVYQAMLARGFRDEMRTMDDYVLRPPDWLLLAAAAAVAAGAIYAGWRL
jgi:cobalt/nickel transport system permease protein